MNRQQAIATLDRLKPDLAKRFGVTRLALFGSMARDDMNPSYYIDIVVSFDSPATLERFFGVQFCLEDALGHPVDLVTEKAMRAELRPFIEKEAINV